MHDSKSRSGVPAPFFVAVEGALYLGFLCLDLACPGHPASVMLKYLAILLCFLTALTFPHDRAGTLVCAALGFTLGADLFLLVLDRWYLAGVALFCVVQTLYFLRICLGLSRRLPAAILARGIFSALVLAAGILLGQLTALTALALFYFLQLLCNTLESFRLPRHGLPFSLGLLLFVGCDLCVGLQNLSLLSPAALSGWPAAFTRVGMWLFYLPSQVLITLSVRKA